MSGRYLTDLADVLRAAGLAVVELDGWQTRARSSGGYDGGPWLTMWHHTASGGDGASDAHYCTFVSDVRPVCNLVVGRDGVVYVCAAGATNTNGSGGPLTLPDGRTVATDSMNTRALGVELSNNGVGMGYPQVQIDAAFAVSNACAAAYGYRPDNVAGHVDWTTRKIDPATAAAVAGPWRPRSINGSGSWAVADLRAECIRRYEEDDDMPTAAEIAAAVWNEPCVSEVDGQTYPVGTFIHSTHAQAFAAAQQTVQGELAPVVWDRAVLPSQDPAQAGESFPTGVYLTAIHAAVVAIGRRLDALEGKGT